jgi:phage-related protein (TIGR01555 family)
MTLNRIVLTYLFTTNGLFQTALQLPIQDAISRGVELESDELSASDIDTVLEFWDDEGIWDTILHAATWVRLYGGGGILINTNQDPETPLRLRGIGRSPLELYDVERWQLDTNFPYTEEFDLEMRSSEFMYLLGKKIHESRFILMKGKRAPSYVRRQLRGWGMSEGERMIRELNLYLKTQDVLYEILDESKIHVYHIKGLAQKLMTSTGTAQVAARVQAANEIKNYVSALMLDSEESFEQKTMSFTGLAEVSRENRIGVAAALRMPVTKLFGMSASGFNSGEDDLESYNQMVESEIRRPLNRMVKAVFDLSFAYLFDYIPKFRFKWPTMRVLTETEHQEVLDRSANRLLSFYDRGLIQTPAVEAEAKKAGIFTTNMNMVINPVPPNGPESVGQFVAPASVVKTNSKFRFKNIAPHKGEDKEKYVSRCIAYLVKNEGKTAKEAAGQCYGMWDESKK